MAQADLLVVELLGLPLERVEAMDDEAWTAAVARARWLEDRHIARVKQGLLEAVAALFRR